MHLQRILSTVIYILKAIHHERNAFVETALVEPVQVGKMNLQPTQATFTERFCFCEHQKTTGQVITNVTQMRRDGVCSSTEVKVMRLVECVSQELAVDQYGSSTSTQQLTAREISIL